MSDLILPGTAQPGDVRASKSFSAGTNYVAQGSMTEYSGTKYTPTAAGILIPQGYHDGTTGTAAEPNLIASNILSGKSIFGVAGNAQSRQHATGSVASSASNIQFTQASGSTAYYYYVTVSGLAFTPNVVYVKISNDWTLYVVSGITTSQPANVQTYSYGNNQNFQTTGNLYVSNGFQLPIANGGTFTWEAWY